MDHLHRGLIENLVIQELLLPIVTERASGTESE